MARSSRLALMLVTAASVGCGGGPRPLVAGTDACDFCRMGVADVRYGAEIVARTGRVYTFDAVECAASWFVSAPQAEGARGVWVADYATGTLIDATTALFVKGGSLRSPMGRSITAFAPSVTAPVLAARYQGDILRWDDVVTYVRAQGIPGGQTTSIRPSAATPTGHR